MANTNCSWSEQKAISAHRQQASGFLPLLEKQGTHSKKPDVVREHILKCYPNLKKLELFARSKYPGFDSWGNEIERDLELNIAPQPMKAEDEPENEQLFKNV